MKKAFSAFSMRAPGFGVGVVVGEGVMMGVAVNTGLSVAVGNGADFVRGLLAGKAHADTARERIIAINIQESPNGIILPFSGIKVSRLCPRMTSTITQGMLPVNES